MKVKKKILFLTGTRADFGKLKPLINATNLDDRFEVSIFVTGMHMLRRYGYTLQEVNKLGYSNVFSFINQAEGEAMELIMANTIGGLSRFCSEFRPDMIVVHGDRLEAMAGAIVGSFKNILVSHIEGGEVSGTIDGLIRHSVSKLAHLHFVTNTDAERRLRQLGEDPVSIHLIGSPDIDIMLSDTLPSIADVKARYDIHFDDYGVLIFHPVTTEIELIGEQIESVLKGAMDSGKNFVVLFPNNDAGSEIIIKAFGALNGLSRFRVFPSLRFEFYLSLLKNARCIVGNSSSGIHEAPVFGIPTLNIGSRQHQRFKHDTIMDVPADSSIITKSIFECFEKKKSVQCLFFGQGKSAKSFVEIMNMERTWLTPRQKSFCDVK